MTNKRGYSLMEIIVTIIILGVLATIVIPNFTTTIEKSKAAEGVQILEALLNAQRIYKYENPGLNYTDTLTDLDITVSALSHFGTPTVDDPPDPVTSPIADITRTGSYKLAINENGDIRCTDDPLNLCGKVGFSSSF